MGRVPTIYYCPYDNCTASYNRKHRYETHLRSHTGEKPFICSQEDCGKSFTSSSHLKRHEDTHESSYRCTVENCPAVLKTKVTLKKHIRNVHLKLKKSKIYTCTRCSKEFNKHNALQRHELRHSGRLPYKCSVENCQKAFLTPSKLKRHMKIHEGYPCKEPHCDKVFGKWSLYVEHMRDVHRSEYKCEVCNKVFSKSRALKLHMPLHQETRLVYPCEVPNCSKYCYEKRYLRAHIKNYHEKRPFMCVKENCHRSFKTEAELTDHILYHGKRKPRKKKPKKPKPSFAAILSGCAEVKQVDRKSKQVLKEETAESDVSASSCKVHLTGLENDIVKISSLDSLELNEESIIEENSPLDLRNAICIKSSEVLSESSKNNSFSSNSNNSNVIEPEVGNILSEENNLEINQPSKGHEESAFSIKSHILPMDCGIDNSLTELEVPECAVQEYVTIEVVGSENLSLISVPIIRTDKHWEKRGS